MEQRLPPGPLMATSPLHSNGPDHPCSDVMTSSPPLTVIHWALLAFSEAPCLDGTNGSFLGAPSIPSMC